jgi:light-regulated signal transduction histidine kinase (bacteriophytochrome)
MESVQEVQADFVPEPRAKEAYIQAGAYLLELSLDWIVLRASENVHHLLGKSHVTLIDEPLGRFVQSQALHDLRNLFSRLSGTTGIARAYGVRLTDEREYFDIAFQLIDGRVLLEAVPSSGTFGEALGGVGGLVAGLSDQSSKSLLDGGARRMRALTGYDRVTLVCGDKRAESSRGAFPAPADLTSDLPTIVSDSAAEPIGIFPRNPAESSAAAALSALDETAAKQLRQQGVSASLRVRFALEDGSQCEFRCESRTPREPSFEVHAAAELFAQLFAMRLEIDRLKNA